MPTGSANAGRRLRGAVVGMAAVALGAAGDLGAQESEPQELQEIVVTSLRRDQSFLEVGASVQLFSQKEIERAGIARPQDFLNLTPNVTFLQSNHAGEGFVNVRGQTSVRQAESAVAVVIDGVQLATLNEFNQDFFDIAQIEVLKGPQGALYGRNAAAGAIVITTQAPSDEFEARGMVSYGNWNSMKTNFAVSGPVTQRLKFRLSGALNESDGPYQNIITGEHSHRLKEKLARVRLDLAVSDRLTVDLRVNGSQVEGGGIAFTAQGPGIVYGAVDMSIIDTDRFAGPFVSDVPGFNEQEKFSTSVKVDYDLGFAKLTSVTAYNNIIDSYGAKLFPYVDFRDPRNDPGIGFLFGDNTQKLRVSNSAYTQELRLTSPGDRRFRWQGGLYFMDSNRVFTNEGGVNGRVPLNPDGSIRYVSAEGVVGYVNSPDGDICVAYLGSCYERRLIGGGTILRTRGIDGLDTVNPTYSYDETEKDARNWAVFANIQYDLRENLELNLAARYDEEKRDVKTVTPDVINPFTGASFNNCVRNTGLRPEQCVGEKTFSQLQPKISLTYHPTDSASIYASYGRSFKSGGFNAIGTRELLVRNTVEALGLPREVVEQTLVLQDSYDKEVADSCEIGFKSRFLGYRVSLNGAVFWTDVKDSQQFFFYPLGGIEAVSGIDKVRIKGFEIDGRARVTDSLTLFAGYGYIDSEILEFRAQPEAIGNRAPYTYRYGVQAGAELSKPVSSAVNLVGRLEFTRSGQIWYDAANTPGTDRGPVNLVNARIGFSTDRWDVSLWSRNLFDKEYNEEAIVLNLAPGLTLNPHYKGRPRSYGVELRGRF